MKIHILDLLQKLKNNELIVGSFYVFLGGMLVSVINFFFNLFLTRNLSYVDYGIYAAILSLIALLAIPSQVISPVILRYATKYSAHKDIGKAKYFFKQSILFMCFAGFGISLFLFLFSSSLNNFLKLGNTIYILVIGLLTLVGYISSVLTIHLQGILKFRLLAVISLLGTVTKVLVGGLLILFGWKIWGVLGGLTVFYLISIVLTSIPLLKLFFHQKIVPTKEQTSAFSKYSVISAISMLALTSFTSSDILLVKHFLPASQAGLYAGLSLVGKVIIYFTSPILTVLFPLLMNKFHKGEQLQEILLLAFLLIGVPSISAVIIYFMFPAFFITLFLGGRGYLTMVPYVGLYASYITFFIGVNILTTYFLTLYHTKAVYLIGTVALLQIIGIYFFHKTISEIILVLLTLMCALFLCLTYLWLKHVQRSMSGKAVLV